MTAARAQTGLPTGEEKSRVVRGMFDDIADRYDLVNRIMTFGRDRAWRARAAATLGLSAGAVVADVACGTGDFLAEARRRDWRGVGVDFSGEMLVRAAARGERALIQADALALPVRDGSVDGITCGFALRNVADLERLFVEMARVLKPGGRIALLETAQPSNAALRAGHSLYFKRVVPLIGGALSNRAAYRYLPRSAAYLPPPDELLEMIRAAAFTDVARITMMGGAVQLLIGQRS